MRTTEETKATNKRVLRCFLNWGIEVTLANEPGIDLQRVGAMHEIEQSPAFIMTSLEILG